MRIRRNLSHAILALFLIASLRHACAQALHLSLTQDRATLRWPSLSGHRYVVQHTSQLTSPTWSDLAQIVASGLQTEWTDPNPPSTTSARYYRVADYGEAPVTLSLNQALTAADLAPSDLITVYERNARDTHDAVVAATLLSGSATVVTHGTITLSGDPARPQVAYAPTPTDRLTVVPVTGAPSDLFILAYRLTPNQDDVILNEWRAISGATDLRFGYQPGQAADLATVTGTYESTSFPGTVFQVDLRATLQGYSTVDTFGSEYLSDITLTGTLDTSGFSLIVHARRRYELITVTGANRGSASTDETWLNHSLTLGPDTLVWNNVKKQRSYRDGMESSLDTYWAATGAVTRNGADYARYRMSAQPVGTSVIDVRFQIELPGPLFLDVGQWIVQVPGSPPSAP